MKKMHLIVYSIIAILYATSAKAQNIKFNGKHTLVTYRKDSDQSLDFTVKYIKDTTDRVVTNISITAVQDGSAQPAFKMDPNPYKLSFGKNYPTSYVFKITLLSDTTITLPCIIKLMIRIDGSSTKLDSCNIIYQPFTELPKTVEGNLIKSNDDLKADINTLKTQIMNGDTSQTYIGKFVIRPDAAIVPAGDIGKKIKSIPILMAKMAEAIKDTRNIIRSFGKNIGPSVNIKGKDPNKPAITVSRKAIDSVILTIREGEIEFIKVKLRDTANYFTNMYAPISLLNIEKRFKDKLYSPLDGSYIFLKEAINFEVEKRFNYFPSNRTLFLTNNSEHPKKEVKVFANNGLNTFVDLRVFTDLLGVLDNKPNGLLQVEGKSRLYLHRSNIFNRFMYAFYGFEPYLGVSKFDTKYDTVKISNVKDTINRMALFQRSFLKVGLKLNVFRWDFRPANSFYFNLGYQFNAGSIAVRNSKNLADSVVSTAILNTPYLESGLNGNVGANFGFEGEVKLMFQQLNKNKYFSNSGYNTVMNFSVTGFFYPATKSKDRFFIRFSDNLNYRDRREDFYQLQFGYSLNVKL